MKIVKLISKVAITAATTILVGCSGDNKSKIVIDGHAFDVPSNYVVDEPIPWLPASQLDGLMFYINPDAPLSKRMSVLVQSSNISCRPPLTSGPLAAACQSSLKSDTHYPNGYIERFYPNNDSTQWSYRIPKGAETGSAIVATCSAMSDGDGLCYSFGIYDDLVYKISLRDSEVRNLPGIRMRVHELLSSWEGVPIR
jgi:hypothetical protein